LRPIGRTDRWRRLHGRSVLRSLFSELTRPLISFHFGFRTNRISIQTTTYRFSIFNFRLLSFVLLDFYKLSYDVTTDQLLFLFTVLFPRCVWFVDEQTTVVITIFPTVTVRFPLSKKKKNSRWQDSFVRHTFARAKRRLFVVL